MNTSPTDRTPGPGRHAYLSAGNAFASARNLLWSVSRSETNCFRISIAVSRFGRSCALAEPALAANDTAATTAARRTERAVMVTNEYRMVVLRRGNGWVWW